MTDKEILRLGEMYLSSEYCAIIDENILTCQLCPFSTYNAKYAKCSSNIEYIVDEIKDKRRRKLKRILN